MARDYYDILGVSKNATQDEIKKMLDNYDVDVNNPNSISQGYSYYENGKTVISIEVIHALGDYFEIVFD